MENWNRLIMARGLGEGIMGKAGKVSSQGTCMGDPRTYTMVWGLTVGAGCGLGVGGQRGKIGTTVIE